MFALKVKFMNLLLYSDPHVCGQLGTKAWLRPPPRNSAGRVQVSELGFFNFDIDA